VRQQELRLALWQALQSVAAKTIIDPATVEATQIYTALLEKIQSLD